MTAPDWKKLDKDRLAAAQAQHDAGVTEGDEHGPIESYVVIDDEDDGISSRHPFVKTDGCIGLTEENARQAIAILATASSGPAAREENPT